MSQHTVPSYQENTTVTLLNNFFLPLSKEKKKQNKGSVSDQEKYPRKLAGGN